MIAALAGATAIVAPAFRALDEPQGPPAPARTSAVLVSGGGVATAPESPP
jgi:hypothetical protein